jgi:hypothetical protein
MGESRVRNTIFRPSRPTARSIEANFGFVSTRWAIASRATVRPSRNAAVAPRLAESHTRNDPVTTPYAKPAPSVSRKAGRKKTHAATYAATKTAIPVVPAPRIHATNASSQSVTGRVRSRTITATSARPPTTRRARPPRATGEETASSAIRASILRPW